MKELFDPARHEALTATRWNEDAVRAAIVRITAAAHAQFDASLGSWPTHALDEPKHADERHHDLFFGAGGVIWALRDLAARGATDGAFPRAYERLLPELPARAAAELAGSGFAHGDASYLCGTSGLLLLQWCAHREDVVADRLFEVVQGNLRNPVLEPLWGSSGSVLAAIHMAEVSGEQRWIRLVRDAVSILLEQMSIDADTGTWIWVQDMYGQRVRYLGAAHGFAGNVYPALRAANLLDAATVETFCERAWHTLDAMSATQRRRGQLACLH